MNNWKNFVKLTWLTAFFMILVLFWDHYGLKLDQSTLPYLVIKSFTIGSFILLGLQVYRNKKVDWQQEAYAVVFYTYCFYGLAFLDMTYSFSFVQGAFLLSLGMRTSAKNYLLVNGLGLAGLVVGHFFSSEPVFVALGQSYRPHSLVANLMLFLIAGIVHFVLQRQQNQIQVLNERFALVGKQSSFLMHEIKTPLNRVVANAEEALSESIMSDIRRDSQKIAALVSSVEVLIHDPRSISKTFTHFDWQELREDLQNDFQTYLSSMNIKLNFIGVEGGFLGNRPLLYQLLRNCIINAIEAIGFRSDVSSDLTVRLERRENKLTLTITNTNSFIPQKDLERIFEPHFTTKKSGTNKGLGLALVKSILDAHSGSVKVTSKDNETSFAMNFPG